MATRSLLSSYFSFETSRRASFARYTYCIASQSVLVVYPLFAPLISWSATALYLYVDLSHTPFSVKPQDDTSLQQRSFSITALILVLFMLLQAIARAYISRLGRITYFSWNLPSYHTSHLLLACGALLHHPLPPCRALGRPRSPHLSI